MQNVGKKLTVPEARQKIYRYCSYQERCHHEVKEKLNSFGLHRAETDEIISQLIVEGFLNEERFARAFAGGKFRMKKWGRIRITNELEQRGLTPNCIKAGLKEIDTESYLNTMHSLLETKAGQIEAENDFARRDKLATYMIRKGYEPDLVWTAIKEKKY